VIAAALVAAATLFVSPAGSDSGRCTSAQPCASLDRAYQVAEPGQVVQIAAGTYDDQLIRPDSKSGNGVVTFVPAPGAQVTLGEVRTAASNLEFDDLTMDDYYLSPGSSNVIFRNDRMHFFFIRSASNVRMVGGSVGGEGEAIPATIGTLHPDDPTPTNVLIDGVSFHDMTRAEKPSGHMECLFVQGVNGLVIRNSRFTHCDIFDVFFKQFQAPQYSNIRLVDNFFGPATDAAGGSGFYSVFFSFIPGASPISDVLVDHNSFAQGFHFDDGSYDNVRVVANVATFQQHQCTDGVQFSYNVFDHARCGPTDRMGALGFVDASTLDLHLTKGSAAIGADRSDTAPPLDIDGQQRPLRLPPDAGADQRLPASLTLGSSIGGISLGAPREKVLALYGTSSRTATRALVPGGPRVEVSGYAVPGGRLSVAYLDDRVVGLGTTSAYFTTPAAFGVGSTARSIGPYDACLRAYRGRRGGAVVVAGGKNLAAAKIASLWLLRPAVAKGRCV
jgi:hypothetical protein